MSTPAIWCRVVRSRDFSVPGPIMCGYAMHCQVRLAKKRMYTSLIFRSHHKSRHRRIAYCEDVDSFTLAKVRNSSHGSPDSVFVAEAP